MRARIWGCRGSLAAPGPSTLRYGGNTSCLEVRGEAGGLVVLDAGTGIRALGLTDLPDRIHLLLTHLHIDHIEGLGFFRPVWLRDTELHVWGPPSPTRTLEERIARYLSPPLFPRELSELPCRLVFHDVPAEEWELEGLRVLAGPVAHPGPTVGYRLSENGRALAYIPDHEPALATRLDELEGEWISGWDVATGADVLLHDAQFTETEYPLRVGWGHSSVAHAVSFAARAQVQRLLLFHHDPSRSDEELESLLARARELSDGKIELAYEGAGLAV
jgi:phosphoribosyl 1,2-cyclic phosphodiesterase